MGNHRRSKLRMKVLSVAVLCVAIAVAYESNDGVSVLRDEPLSMLQESNWMQNPDTPATDPAANAAVQAANQAKQAAAQADADAAKMATQLKARKEKKAKALKTLKT